MRAIADRSEGRRAAIALVGLRDGLGLEEGIRFWGDVEVGEDL